MNDSLVEVSTFELSACQWEMLLAGTRGWDSITCSLHGSYTTSPPLFSFTYFAHPGELSSIRLIQMQISLWSGMKYTQDKENPLPLNYQNTIRLKH